jgi:hypothetical protein
MSIIPYAGYRDSLFLLQIIDKKDVLWVQAMI